MISAIVSEPEAIAQLESELTRLLSERVKAALESGRSTPIVNTYLAAQCLVTKLELIAGLFGITPEDLAPLAERYQTMIKESLAAIEGSIQ